MIAQDKLERALSLYQVLKDMHKDGIAGVIELKKRRVELLEKVLTVLEDAI